MNDEIKTFADAVMDLAKQINDKFIYVENRLDKVDDYLFPKRPEGSNKPMHNAELVINEDGKELRWLFTQLRPIKGTTEQLILEKINAILNKYGI